MDIIDESVSLFNSYRSVGDAFSKGARLSERGKTAPLVTVTKTSSPVDFKGLFCRDTGEVLSSELVRDYRSERWALKSAAVQTLGKCRTSKCMVLRAPDPVRGGLRDIEVCKSDKL